MRSRWLLVIPLLMCAGTAGAEKRGWVPEIRPVVGAYVPTGDLRHVLSDAVLVGGQAAVELADRLHLVGTFAWSPSEDSRLAFDNGISLFQYDAGLELFQNFALSPGWMLRPFLGAGGGGRTFDYRTVDADRQTYGAGYAALGTELQTRRFALRLEGRDYFYSFKGLSGDENAKSQDDLTIVAGAAFHLW